MPDILTCQYCQGVGYIGPVHVNRGDSPHQWLERVDCSECGGTGTWSVQRAINYRDGQAMRTARVDRGESLREASKRLGITAAELCSIEAGRAILRSSQDTTK